jgi:hypothetical protein
MLLLKDTKLLRQQIPTDSPAKKSLSSPVAPRPMHMVETGMLLHVEGSVAEVVVGSNKVDREAKEDVVPLDRTGGVEVLLEVAAQVRQPTRDFGLHISQSQDADFCPSFQGYEHSAVYHTRPVA